jgi:hypothetical protein
MKKLVMLVMAVSGLLSACVAYEVPGGERGANRGDREREHEGMRDRSDRDDDRGGNVQDRRPDDGRRY